MIGIYKITSPSKRIYIGQSINIEKRFKQYKRLSCEGQKRLSASFKKYGVDKHTFEVITECDINELNDKERYYQELYDVINKKGLNCVLTKTNDRSGKLCKDTIDKMIIAYKNRKYVKCQIEVRKRQSKTLSENINNNNRLMLFNEKRKKAILVYDYDTDKLISSFNSIRECARVMKIDRKSINLSCKNIYPYAYGFRFKYYLL